MTTWCESTFNDMDEQRMAEWLRQENLHDCVGPFLRKKINGLSFLNLSEFEIKTFQISQESKRKLTKYLKRIKPKRRNHPRSSGGDSADIREPKTPSAILAHISHHDEGDSENDWGSDFDSEDEDEEDESGSDGDYIEPEADESLPEKDPIVPTGLVAQLRAGLSGSFRKHPFASPPSGHSHTQLNSQPEETEDIYDVPPDEEVQQEEFYEVPSDDSGSGIVVRPMDKKKVIRCPPSSTERGEYIDARAPSHCDKEDTVPCPPAPSRPPKPGKILIKPYPPVQQQSPAPPPDIYEVPSEGEQPGCSQVVSVAPGGIEVYEPLEDCLVCSQETCEFADNTPTQDTYEIPDPQQDQDTYEIPEPEQTPPARPPARGTGWNHPKPTPMQEKTKLIPSKKPGEQKLAKPVPASKPQISPKPGPPNPVPTPEKQRSSRLYPNLANKAPLKQLQSIKRNPAVLPSPAQKQATSPPPQQTMPSRQEENNNDRKMNNERKINNEMLNNMNSPRIPPPRKQPPTSPIDDSPPLPPRPGAKPPSKPNRTSDPDIPDSVGPTSPLLMKSPLPPLPTQPKHSADPLKNSPWFHGPLDKEIAGSALKSFKKEGAFIVRNSSEGANKYSMSLFFNGKVRHLRMPRTNDKYVLGDNGKVQFTTIVELVDYYSQHKVDLKSGGSTTLTAACPVK